MNNELLMELHLDARTISLDRMICRGLAEAYSRQAERSTSESDSALAVAATYFRRAGADALLLGKFADASSMFSRAAAFYEDLNLPYSLALAALTEEARWLLPKYVESWLYGHRERALPAQASPQLAYVLLAQTSLASPAEGAIEASSVIRRDLEPYRARPIGVLGIAVGAILDLHDGLQSKQAEPSEQLTEGLSGLLGTYNKALRETAQNRHHWSRLALPFHPAEPDIYSLLATSDRALRLHWGDSVGRYVQAAPIGAESKLLLASILGGLDSLSARRSEEL